MKGFMLQGTASDVGKSVITTALCRILANQGYTVTPFKSQNMSNYTAITSDGKEIARSQFIQAEAARAIPSVYMNPIVLKPKSEQTSEVVVLGEKLDIYSGKEYREHFYEKGLAAIQHSLEELKKEYDTIIIEGAGSPVEMNLNDRELVNMKVAELANVPVYLITDIERGGVFASLVGTIELLSPAQRARVKGLIINKFRGDRSLFQSGIDWLERRLNIPVVGVIPTFDAMNIEAEDSLSKNGPLEHRPHDYDAFAEHVERHVDVAHMFRTMNEWGEST